ncbi:MAG: hypothetical protein AB8B56_00105 [Crocinitomicaceae bacterium]
MKLHHLFVLLLLFGFISCKKGKNNPESCNGSSTRREVKIATDDLASQIDLTPISISVDSIGGLDVQEAKKNTVRQDVEKKVFEITATVHKLSKHRDGDWKIKLTDGNDKYINCESPNMGCEYIQNSTFFSEMETVRNWIEENKDDLVGKTVTITGVGFIDIDHRFPRNAAENELELHPILDIHF